VLVSLNHGFEYAYATDSVLFLMALYSALRLPPIPPDGSLGRPGLRSVIDGLRFIASRPVLVMSFGVDIVAMVLAMPRSLYPEVADERFHGTVGPLYARSPSAPCWLASPAAGIGRIRRQGVALTVAVVGWGACVAISAWRISSGWPSCCWPSPAPPTW